MTTPRAGLLWAERLLFWALPLGLLAVSYAAVAWSEGTAWPWLRYVHESGDKTLLDTLLYYDHAARELWVDLVLAAAIPAALLAQGIAPRPASPGVRAGLGAAWAATLAAIVLGSLHKVGAAGLLDNLTQMYTRPGAPPEWGSHWRYHLLSRFALILTAWWGAGLLAWAHGHTGPRQSGPFKAVLGVWAVLTLIFLPTLEPFFEPRFLGHQAREAVTHALVTLPLGLGVCLALAQREAGPRVGWPPKALLFAAAAAAILVAWTGLGTVLTGAQEQGQSESLVQLVFVHFFEHGFTYVLTPALAGWLFVRRAGRG
jgi:hypothetical protein